MGYHAHHAIIVTSWRKESIDKAHAEASRIFKSPSVSSITFADINGYWSFLVGPDGSKEGWPDSGQGDENRAAFLAFLGAMWDAGDWLDFVEVRYGGDEPELARVTNNGAPPLQDEDGERKFTLPASGNAPALGG